MDEDRFNMALRKFLKEVGVTSQREIEKVVREHPTQESIRKCGVLAPMGAIGVKLGG